MDEDKKILYWHSLSEYDIQTAHVMLEGARYLYVGFMCHQAVEKALKACHWRQVGQEPEYTHSLLRLSRKCGVYEDMPENVKDFLDILEPLNIEARYPTNKEKLMQAMNKNRCEEIYMRSKEALKWLQGKYLK